MSLPATQRRSPAEEPSGLAAVLPAAPSTTVYDEYYGFIEPPFSLTPNTRFFFWGGSHAHVMEQVMMALRAREGVVVVTGANGTGKTMLCWMVAHHVRTHALLSTFVNPTLGPDDLLKQILLDFGVVPGDRPIGESGYALFRMLEQFLVARIPQGDRAVILIDEAHQLQPEVLEQIRLLSNLESEHAKLLQIILIGLPELEAVLRRPEHQQFDQRVSRRCELLPLTPSEIGRYIDRRLAIAQAFTADAASDPSPVQPVLDAGDASEALQVQRVGFTAEALAEMAARTRGIPRQINLLSDRALEVGHEHQAHSIDRALVIAAAARLKLAGPRPWLRGNARVALASAAVLAFGVLAATTGWWIARRPPQAQGAPPTESRPTTTPTPVTTAVPVARRLETSPSVILAAVSFETIERADEVVRSLERLGLPAFSRLAPASRWHQVLIGPYASVDEARAAEDRLPTLRITDPVILLIGRAQERARAPSTRVTRGNSIDRVLMLPVEDRGSLLVELHGPAVQASRESASDTELVADIGPIAGPVVPDAWDAAPDTPLVSHVSTGEVAKPGKGTFIRLHVVLRTPSHSQVRVAGQRVYLDFSPLVPSTSPRGLPETIVEQAAYSAGEEAPPAPPARPTAPRAAMRGSIVVAAQVLERARELAGKSDVRGLEELHAEVRQRSGASSQQPDEVKHVLEELERYTLEARGRRLQQDAGLFQRAEDERYRTAMRPILTRLEQLQPALVAATKRASSAGSAAAQLQAIAAVRDQLGAVTAPPGMAATHQRVRDALGLMTDALLHPGDDAARRIAEAVALLHVARADITTPRSVGQEPRP